MEVFSWRRFGKLLGIPLGFVTSPVQSDRDHNTLGFQKGRHTLGVSTPALTDPPCSPRPLNSEPLVGLGTLGLLFSRPIKTCNPARSSYVISI